jgi:hypothetical protein
MVSDPSIGTSRPRRSTTVRVAIWVLAMIALLEVILAAVALAPRIATNFRNGAYAAQTSAPSSPQSVPPSQSSPFTAANSGNPIPSQDPASFTLQTATSFSQSQPVEDSPLPNQLLGNRLTEKPPRQPPADAALNGEAALQIVNATLQDAADGSKKLQVAIKANPNEQIDSAQEKIQVYFYDQDGEEIVPSKAQVTSRWLNWKSGEPQLVEVSYLPESVDPGIKFAGYVIAIYYKGDLQDCRSQPSRLQKQFEPKYYIGTDE